MILDIIDKKRKNEELSYVELDYFFNGYLKKEVKDYQMSALLMAICINGLTKKEIVNLTKIFIDSGEVLKFNTDKIIVDKHSTGGIGDKTTLVVAPIVAACGVPVIKMSGRGLGYTGGTIDKLESIPGYNVNQTPKKIEKQFEDIGIVLCSQSANLVPMDKLIYALRDVSGTVSSIGLIAVSIMSKKIAGGADKILLDIKYGKGALLEKKKDAQELGDIMVDIGKSYKKEVRYILSNMDVPLGYAVGNSIEVFEAIDILCGDEKDNILVDLCVDLASNMVSMGKNISLKEAKKQVLEVINNGKAYNKFLELIKYQGGDIKKLKVSNITQKYKSKKSGIIKDINALSIGKISLSLGSGRVNKEDEIDYDVGIELNKLVGEKVKKGEVLCKLYVNKKINLSILDDVFTIEE